MTAALECMELKLDFKADPKTMAPARLIRARLAPIADGTYSIVIVELDVLPTGSGRTGDNDYPLREKRENRGLTKRVALSQFRMLVTKYTRGTD